MKFTFSALMILSVQADDALQLLQTRAKAAGEEAVVVNKVDVEQDPVPECYRRKSLNKRCSNYKISGQWTRTRTTDITLHECAEACKAKGKCNIFSYGHEGGKTVCLFNAPVDCKEENVQANWGRYNTYTHFACRVPAKKETHDFAYVTKGTCESAGYDLITSKEECVKAGNALGNRRASGSATGNRPGRCGTWARTRWFHYNEETYPGKIKNPATRHANYPLRPCSGWTRCVCKAKKMGKNYALGQTPIVSSEGYLSTGKHSKFLTDGKIQTPSNKSNNMYYHSDPFKDPSPVIKIPLGTNLAVTQVKVWNRCDCCADRLGKGFQVFVGNTLCGDIPDTPACQAATIECNGASGNSVTVKWVKPGEKGNANIVEIEVFGGDPKGTTPGFVSKDKNWFNCRKGNKMIPVKKLCDGSKDCPDNSDEYLCTPEKTYSPALAERSSPWSVRHSKRCGADHNSIMPGTEEQGVFRCLGTWCVHSVQLCDGVRNCGDNSDEKYCEATTDVMPSAKCFGEDAKLARGSKSADGSAFRCRGGYCIPGENLCNGSPNCGDKSDEHDDFCNQKCWVKLSKPCKQTLTEAGSGGTGDKDWFIDPHSTNAEQCNGQRRDAFNNYCQQGSDAADMKWVAIKPK